MKRCKVCKRFFTLKKENLYLITQLSPFVTYEAFDCPYCGCQNVVGVREGYQNHKKPENATNENG